LLVSGLAPIFFLEALKMGDKGSLTIFRVKGIPVRIHFTFLIILPYLAYVIARATPALGGLAGVNPDQMRIPYLGMGFILALFLFACVLIHEWSHVWVGLKGGGKVEGITLMIVGGVSEISELPPRPSSEAAMAAAGPVSSLVLAFLSLAGYSLVSASPDLRFALYYLFYMNLVLAIFNALPAFPMDGGRILRALLSMITSRVRATRIASWVGQGMAVLFFVAGLLSYNWVLMLIGFLVVLGARAEWEMVKAGLSMNGLKVEQAMVRFPPTLEADESLSSAIERVDRERKTTYFVVSQGALLGAVLSSDIAQQSEIGLPKGRAEKNWQEEQYSSRLVERFPEQSIEHPIEHPVVVVSQLVRKDVPRLRSQQDLASAARLLRTSEYDSLPVLQDGMLLGSVSFASIASAIRARDSSKSGGPHSYGREIT
jgi:Zn-dependent protease